MGYLFHPHSLPDVGPIEDPEPVDTDSIDAEVDLDEDTTKDVAVDQGETDRNQMDTKPLNIEQVEHHPQPAPTRQKMRIQRKSGIHSGNSTTKRVIDPDFVERKVMEFEESIQPSRFPLRVGQLMGSDAPGCDILSFDSAADRDKFQSGQDREMSNILRFIEVKGRKNENAEIELRGNELDAAIKYGERYYLYRLFWSGENGYSLSILQDPHASDEALEAAVYVHLNRANAMEQYEMSGGISSDEAGDSI